MSSGPMQRDRALVEPPRDGEFFFEEGFGDEGAPGAITSLWSALVRHPALSVGSVLGVALVVTSLVLVS